jgi:hypothetical protein
MITNIILVINLLLLIASFWYIRVTLRHVRGLRLSCKCSGIPILKKILDPRPGGIVKRPMKVVSDEERYERGE